MKFDIYNPAFMQDASNMSKCFRIKSNVDNNIISFDGFLLGDFSENIEYSTDTQKAWNQLDNVVDVTLDKGDYLYFRNKNDINFSGQSKQIFLTTGTFDVYGDVTKLLYPTSTIPDKAFKELFISTLVERADYLILPNDLSSGCFQGMFYQCKHLVSAPNILSADAATYCCESMFQGCESLQYPPKIEIKKMANYAYKSMFAGCISLMVAPKLPAMVNNTYYAYHGMFEGCTSLKEAPELPTKESLDQGAYLSMFKNCTSLIKAPILPATTVEYVSYGNMFEGCTSLKEAPELPAMTLSRGSYQAMFKGCTSLIKAPVLPAIVIPRQAYYLMFHSCKSLDKICCLAEDISKDSATYGWVSGVRDIGVFIKSPNMNDWQTGVSGIPEGWTVEDYVV